MPLQALGPLTVPTPGTKVAVASLIPAEQWTAAYGPFKGHGILFQALADNTDAVALYQRKRDGTDVLIAVLAVPTANFIPSFSAALTNAPNSIVFSDLYLDAGMANEGALVTILVN